MTVASQNVDLVKMHGAQNAFWLYDERAYGAADVRELAVRLCADPATRADGVLVIGASDSAAATMRVINADGSVAEMCGNGVRCVARYLAERGAGDRFAVATAAGTIACSIASRDGAWRIVADVGVPRFPRGEAEVHTASIDGGPVAYTFVSLGNPHAVRFVDGVDAFDLERFARAFARLPEFPEGVNVHVAERTGARTVRARHYERGVGETPACGTGAVAIAVAARLRLAMASPLDVDVPGGRLDVSWAPGESALLGGPAEVVETRAFAVRS